MHFFHPKAPRLRLLPLHRILPSPWPLRRHSEEALEEMVATKVEKVQITTGIIKQPVQESHVH